MSNKIKICFTDLTYGMKYHFLEYASEKDRDELISTAKKLGLVVPSPDFAIFKAVFAKVNTFNRNGCRLPEAEVKIEGVLQTLKGKLIDFNHDRSQNCGFWIDAKLEDDKIIAYGIFWKSAFPEQYVEIKEQMENGKKKISMECWGDREMLEDGKYDLTNLHFAGGALLDVDLEPAEPEAEIIEMSRIGKRLEFASFIEKAYSCECLSCGKTIDTEEHCKDIKCPDCGGEMRRAERPGAGQPGNKSEWIDEVANVTYSDRTDLPDLLFALVTIKNDKKIRKFPIHDKSHVEDALARLEQEDVKENLEKLGVSLEDVKEKVLARAEELQMALKTELTPKKKDRPDEKSALNSEQGENLMAEEIKKEEQLEEKAEIKEEIKVEEKAEELPKEEEKVEEAEEKTEEEPIEEAKEESVEETEEAKVEEKSEEPEAEPEKSADELKAEIAELTKKLDEISKERDEYQAEIARRDKEIRDAEVAKRKETLGNYAEGLSDEDIMDEIKFENAKLKKEIAELKAKKPEKAEKEEETLETGRKGSSRSDVEKTAEEIDKEFIRMIDQSKE